MSSNIIDVILRLHDGVSGGLTAMQGKFGAMQKTLNTVGNDFTRTGKKIQRLGASIASTGVTLTKGITVPMALIGGACTKVEVGFEQTMKNIQAFTKPTTEEFEKMKAKVEEMATGTKFNLDQTGEAMLVLAKNGMGAKGSMDALKDVMYLAGGSGEDLTETADMVSKGLNAFSMDAKDTGKLTDLLTVAMQNSSASTLSVAEGFKYSALQCKTLGYNVTDTMKFLTILEQNGKNGSVAGTTLRTTLARLNSENKNVKKALQGIADTTGITINKTGTLQELMDSLRESFKKLDKNQQAYYANQIGGQRGQDAIFALLGMEDEAYNNLCKAMDNAKGSTEELYNTATDTTQGRLHIMVSQLEMIAHLIGQRLLPVFDKLIGKTSTAKEAGTGINGVLEKIINFMQKNDGKDFDKLFDKIMKIAPAIMAIGPSMFVFGKLTGLVGTLTVGFGGFWKILGKGAGTMKNMSKGLGQVKALMGGQTVMKAGKQLSIGASKAGLLERALLKVAHPIKTLGSIGSSVFSRLSSGVLSMFFNIKNGSTIFHRLPSIIGGSFTKIVTKSKSAGSLIVGAFKSAPSKILFAFKHPLSSIGGLFKGMSKVGVKALKGMFHPIQSVIKLTGKMSTFFGRGAKAIFKLMSPATKIKLVMLALAVVAGLVYKNWDKIRPVITKLVNQMKHMWKQFKKSDECKKLMASFESLKQSVGTLIETLKPIISLIIQKIIELMPKIIEGAKSIWTAVQPVLSGIFDLIIKIIPVIVEIVTTVIQVVSKIIQILTPVFNLIVKIVTWIITNVGSVLVTAIEVASGGISKAVNAISTVFNGMFGIIKTVVNGVIGLINKMIGAINKISIDIPEGVPVVGGTHIGFNLSPIPTLAKGTDWWKGGIVQISEKGGEIVDLPRGSRVYPHDKSVQKAYADGKASSGNGVCITIPKLADKIVVREDADIDAIVDKMSKKLLNTARNMGGMNIGYLV